MGFLHLSLETNRRLEVANFSHFREPFPHPDRVLAIHDLVYLVSGSWEIGEGDDLFRLAPGDVVVLSAGRRHFGGKGCAPGTRTLWIHVHPEPADRWLPGQSLPENREPWVNLPTFLRCGRDGEIRALFEGVIHHHWSSSPDRRMKARLLVSELIHGLSALAHRRLEPAYGAIDTVTSLLESRPEKTWSLDALAAHVGLERRTLTTHFRRRTGTSIHRFALEHRLRMAASVLTHASGTPVREVASMFGFWDEFHFSRAFKKYHGKSPSECGSTRRKVRLPQR